MRDRPRGSLLQMTILQVCKRYTVPLRSIASHPCSKHKTNPVLDQNLKFHSSLPKQWSHTQGLLVTSSHLVYNTAHE